MAVRNLHLKEGKKKERGTEIILHIAKDEKAFLEEVKDSVSC